ncbi:MAG: hypothetical protein OEY38_14740 [Gammaproteobacteria bacterium]|nr:hypothetical protein [Gammaproteobacteria bacterium]
MTISELLMDILKNRTDRNLMHDTLLQMLNQLEYELDDVIEVWINNAHEDVDGFIFEVSRVHLKMTKCRSMSEHNPIKELRPTG